MQWAAIPAKMDEMSREIPTVPAGIACSLLLHAAVIALLMWAVTLSPSPSPLSPKRVSTFLVDLVQLGEETRSPEAAEKAILPQQRTSETAANPNARAIPIPQTPPPNARRFKAAEAAPSEDHAAERDAEAGKPAESAPADALVLQLERLAKRQQPPSNQPPDPRTQEGPGYSNDTAASSAKRGLTASYQAKDFIRRQVERHWYWDRGTLPSPDWVIAVNITIDPDGVVQRAEVVDHGGHPAGGAYADFAQSIRNAVLLSSPFALLPNSYDMVGDMELDFSEATVSR